MNHSGEIWSAIRSRLPHLRQSMAEAVAADRYEVESAILDHIARELADAVDERAGRKGPKILLSHLTQ